jgi:hypothetical protein
MDERAFISRIDCAFPYDVESGLLLIREATQISTNACFMIGEELSRPPRSAVAPVDVRLHLLALLRQAFEHPLRDPILDAVATRIRGDGIELDAALALARQLEPYVNQLCALNIVYFACEGDEEQLMDAECDRIRERWAQSITGS